MICIFSAGATWVVYAYMNNDMKKAASQSGQDVRCSIGPKHAGLASSDDPRLKKLAAYEGLCGGAVVDRMMVFRPMPTTPAEASQFAHETAETLHAFAANKIEPLVLFEPSLHIPTIVTNIKDGQYDQILDQYFRDLQSESVTTAQMGMWVLFPEANNPSWHTTRPDDFVRNVTKVARIQKRYFPASKTSILLDNRTYPDNDTEWRYGEVKSLLPYVNGIPRGLIDSFGYQGFPTQSPKSAKYPYKRLQASSFLPIGPAQEAAKALGVKEVWLNTGTYSAIYASQPNTAIRISAQQRGSMLKGIVRQARKLSDVSVSVNIFAQNKSQTSEGIDWSYWSSDQPGKSKDAVELVTFISTLRHDGIGFSLYDSL